MKIFRYLNPEAAPPPDDAKNTTPEDKARKKGERMKKGLNQREKKILKAAADNLSRAGIGDRRKARAAINTLLSSIRPHEPQPNNDPEPQPRKKAAPRRHITQEEAAVIWDVSVRTIRAWERGRGTPEEYCGRNMDVFSMRRLAKLYMTSKGVKKGAIKRYSYDENRASDNRRE